MFKLSLVRPVTFDASKAWNNTSRKKSSQDKRLINKRFRRNLKIICDKMTLDDGLWDEEPFNLPQLTDYDID